jgi:FixJ family two-component response regulator
LIRFPGYLAFASYFAASDCLRRRIRSNAVEGYPQLQFRKWSGRQLIMTVMEVDTENPVLVLARSYDRGCYEEAMQSGALDYVEGPLSEAGIVAILETFIPHRAGSRGTSANRLNGAR